MKNKGFTLVEMIAVIVVLSIIITITIPIVVNRIESSKQKLYDVQIKEIERAAESWAGDLKYLDSLPDQVGDSITLNLADLKIAGLLKIDIVNPLTNKSFPNDMIITIKKLQNQYEIKVIEDSGTDITEDNIIVKDSPVIILNGQYLTYLELNDTYQELGATARSSEGVDLSNLITIEVMKNGVQQAGVDSSQFGTYLLYYVIVDPENGYRNTANRTVVVRDTTPPVINLEETTTITQAQVSGFNYLSGVTVKDNSNANVTLNYTGSVQTTKGSYIITYTATDQSGNTSTKKRIIRVD